jgi:hypothetical protein
MPGRGVILARRVLCGIAEARLCHSASMNLPLFVPKSAAEPETPFCLFRPKPEPDILDTLECDAYQAVERPPY